jgi:hypothetical protein
VTRNERLKAITQNGVHVSAPSHDGTQVYSFDCMQLDLAEWLAEQLRIAAKHGPEEEQI